MAPLSSSIDLLATLSVVVDVVVVVVAVDVANAASLSNASLTASLFKARIVLSEGSSNGPSAVTFDDVSLRTVNGLDSFSTKM